MIRRTLLAIVLCAIASANSWATTIGSFVAPLSISLGGTGATDSAGIANVVGTCDGLTATMTVGIDFAGTTTDAIVQGVDLTQGNTTPIAYGGGLTASRIEGNPGFNPAGNAPIVVGSSPFGYTAGPTSEYVCLVGGTVSDVEVTGAQAANTTNTCYMLQPNQTEVVTYSGLPVMTVSKQ